MMRRWWLLAVAAWCAAASGSDSAAPFAWTLRAPGTATHYLVGSIHMLPPAAHPLPDGLERAYSASRRLIVESDPLALSSTELQGQMLAAGTAGDAGLTGEIPAPLYARLRTQLGRLGLPQRMCDALRAWLCALTLELSGYQRAGFVPDLGIDRHFFDRARADGKPVAWLETPQQQLALFTQMPDGLGREFLASALDGVGDPDMTPQRMLEAWQQGDVAFMHAQIEQLRRDHPGAYARLLSARNRAWLDPLEDWLREPLPTLVVVGAAHLVGDDGLVDALRARGFELDAGVRP